MQNSLLDVHNKLMEELERLSDDDLTRDAEALGAEIRRAEAMAKVSQAVSQNISTVLKGALLMEDMLDFKGRKNMEHVLAMDDPCSKQRELKELMA